MVNEETSTLTFQCLLAMFKFGDLTLNYHAGRHADRHTAVGETRASWTLFSVLNFGIMPDIKVSFRNAHVRKFKQLSSYIAV